MYTPKHRGEPVVKYRVHFMESERGWGQDFWTVDFDTEEEANSAFLETNAQNTDAHTPDCYIQATKIEEVVL